MIHNSVFYYAAESIYSTPYEAWVSNEKCSFYYHDEIFEKVDWKTEPTQTLPQLYAERAKQIRDDYEYVILCYSGGNDSSNILETFYYNNIHIDEIVMVGSFSQDVVNESLDENHNTDLYRNAFPLLKTLNLPNTKITTIDYTTLFRDINQFSLIQKYGVEWIKHIGTHKSPHNLFWNNFRKFVGPNNTKKTAWIMGVEKVIVQYDSCDKPYVSFNDAVINDYGMNYVDENFKRINFYCDPDLKAIKIQIKQAHLYHNTVLLSPMDLKKKLLHTYNPTNRLMLKDRLFYEPKNPLIFQSKKSNSSFLSARDQFLLKNQNSDIYQSYISALSTDSKYFRTEGGRGYYTQPYYIT